MAVLACRGLACRGLASLGVGQSRSARTRRDLREEETEGAHTHHRRTEAVAQKEEEEPARNRRRMAEVRPCREVRPFRGGPCREAPFREAPCREVRPFDRSLDRTAGASQAHPSAEVHPCREVHPSQGPFQAHPDTAEGMAEAHRIGSAAAETRLLRIGREAEESHPVREAHRHREVTSTLRRTCRLECWGRRSEGKSWESLDGSAPRRRGVVPCRAITAGAGA